MARLGTLLTFTALFLVGCESRSSANAADAPSPESQAEAKQIIGRWYDSLVAAKSAAVEFTAKVEVTKDGEVVQEDASTYRLVFERPNRFALTTVKGENLAVTSDGKQFYQYAEPLKKYELSDAPPATIADAAKSRLLQFVAYKMQLGIVGDALKAGSLDALWQEYSSPSLVGKEEKNGVQAYHVRVQRDEMPFDLWIGVDSPRLLVFSPDIAAGLAGGAQQLPPGVKYDISMTFKDWSYDQPLPADAFAISPPSDAEWVDDLFAQPPHALLGKQAPAFDTTDLEGKPLKLADLKGKVVMLDFWATWCGPCVAALPKVTEVAAKYKDKDVVFYAVNQQEPASIIKEFLAAKELKTPVAMDPEGTLGTAYGVEGIPQTVIIDKNGKVQVVHVGAGEDIAEQLKKDLDAVLAGRDLADEKLKKKKPE